MTPPVAANLRVAIIGGGAAGLAAARAFSKNGIRPVVLEQDLTVGGIWHYVQGGDIQRPMYRGLRTNLPKEVMAYPEYPWPKGPSDESYVTHQEVYKYLNSYAQKFDLFGMIKFGCKVTNLQVLTDETSPWRPSEDSQEHFKPISLTWRQQDDESVVESTFDAVCVCNGHFAVPSTPKLDGIESFSGQIMHSISYDDPKEFEGKVVVCVGAMASGSDLAREISEHAKHIFVSDTGFAESPITVKSNVTWVPRTQRVDGSSVFFSGTKIAASNVDTILFCTGYDYSFPFIHKDSSKFELNAVPGERRVLPVYEQLWHPVHPNLSFVGLGHSNIPFPIFECQCEAIVAHLLGTATLASQGDRMEAAQRDAVGGGPKEDGRIQDTHYLGAFQWEYCRKMLRIAGKLTPRMDRHISVNRDIYNHAGSQRKGTKPGEPDTYRSTVYERVDKEATFRVIRSEVVNEINGSK
eukprot:CAMPEP_0194049616 /NCGR_PEP_ID=MMETSP0009_2-20130614/30788_1 /TAXON_ID=210454 /ORGANISM="Grammatophora oceanica, Strain CCMP 410" /LENGTH=464 /DNA_ID=CAMNT_0038695817 /DNA_START=47 /DNA_END=1441 /DNA_ORIENTATION=+